MRVSWAGSATVTFVLLLAGVYLVLPGYARKFALRAQVRGHLRAGGEPAPLIACYPRRYDSVSFYARGADVRAYNREQRRELIAVLTRQPETLLFVRADGLAEVLAALPDGLEFVRSGRQGGVAVGWVRPRGWGMVAGSP
jgi:hypothetical protein